MEKLSQLPLMLSMAFSRSCRKNQSSIELTAAADFIPIFRAAARTCREMRSMEASWKREHDQLLSDADCTAHAMTPLILRRGSRAVSAPLLRLELEPGLAPAAAIWQLWAGPGKRGQWSPAASSSRETEGVLAVFMLSRLRLPGHLLLSLINYISFRSPFPTRISHLCGHTFPCSAHRAFPALGGN